MRTGAGRFGVAEHVAEGLGAIVECSKVVLNLVHAVKIYEFIAMPINNFYP